MTTTTRRRRAATLTLALLLVALLALAACGDGGGGGGDGVATLDESAAGDEGGAADDAGDGGDGGPDRPADDPEFQDAMLEFAQCMRDHGIDMPDPEFSDEGGVSIGGPPGEGGAGPDDEEWRAAEEACRPIMDEAVPDEMRLDPEEQAELQDRLVEQAECMREKGYDMPDPEVDANGRVTARARGGEGDGGPPPDDEQFREDMDDCGGPVGPGGPRGDSDERDSDSRDSDDDADGDADHDADGGDSTGEA